MINPERDCDCVAVLPVDFRCGNDARAGLVQKRSGSIRSRAESGFTFEARRPLQILLWDGTGLVLIYSALVAMADLSGADQRRRHASDAGAVRSAV